ncbi:hypothetical protein GGI02_005071 [Coemansia sp. RSA 2322]|nr:hypothetical protein GGI02_005071 [Coemansia sp. RSA 2322]
MWATVTRIRAGGALQRVGTAARLGAMPSARAFATPPQDPSSEAATVEAPLGMTAEEAAAKLSDSRPKTKKGLLLEKQRVRAHLRRLLPQFEATGSRRTKALNPPTMLDHTSSNLALETMMAAGMHLGHSASLWNPMNLPYIFGEREGVHIINLEHTMAALRRAAHFVKQVAYNGGLVLFVGTRKSHQQLAVDAALHAEQYFVMGKWIPGTLTNPRPLLGQNLAYAGEVWDVEEARDYFSAEPLASSGSDKGQAKRPGQDRYLQKLAKDKARLIASRDAQKTYKPDLIIALNPLECRTMLAESQLAFVPTVGIVDTNCDPRSVTYPIPCNDDRVRAVTIVAGVLARAARDGLDLRKAQLSQAAARQSKIDMELAANRQSSTVKVDFD